MLWAMYTGMLGIRPDFQGITFAPRIPKALANPQVGIRLMDKHLQLRYTGFGDRLVGIVINEKPVDGDRVDWDDLPENAVVEIHVASLT
jgi:cellobiose phosphorylase